MPLKNISIDEARVLLEKGAVLVDVRERDETGREWIEGARLLPLSTAAAAGPLTEDKVIFFCRSGNRTAVYADNLAKLASHEAYALKGGIEAWKRAAFPVQRNERRPIEVLRQTQIAIGSLILLGIGLGAYVDPWFYAISAFVGAGLVFAGVTGTCAMANLIALAPWNKR